MHSGCPLLKTGSQMHGKSACCYRGRRRRHKRIQHRPPNMRSLRCCGPPVAAAAPRLTSDLQRNMTYRRTNAQLPLPLWHDPGPNSRRSPSWIRCTRSSQGSPASSSIRQHDGRECSAFLLKHRSFWTSGTRSMHPGARRRRFRGRTAFLRAGPPNCRALGKEACRQTRGSPSGPSPSHPSSADRTTLKRASPMRAPHHPARKTPWTHARTTKYATSTPTRNARYRPL
mmetsp:Transcript_44627/g.128978  ORF Transcript_44627/g.128978 Transcript_44627/m.128978 type:complete len:228 (+) Transcript_44627:198-881(+)